METSRNHIKILQNRNSMLMGCETDMETSEDETVCETNAQLPSSLIKYKST